jgi:hypothetical protein
MAAVGGRGRLARQPFRVDTVLELPALDLTLPFAELYRDVDFVLSEVG